MRKYFFLLLIYFSKYAIFSQFKFNFQDSIDVIKNSFQLAQPWGGGLNNAQFSDIDYDFDGDLDLFVFDRSNDQIRLFVQENLGAQKYYRLDPLASLKFPADLGYRAVTIDYNGDGKKDLFTYGIGGIKVYKNSGSALNGLTWDLASNLLYSDNWGIKMNLYVSSSDIPAIVDVDNDGDLDVLTYHIGGEHIQYHQNQSQELFNHSDSLVFVLKNECWGGFREDVNTNFIHLNDASSVCNSQNVPDPKKTENPKAHAGSTVLALDIDGSGVKDLILGDVAYPNLNLLINGGLLPNTNSKMISQDASFPSNSTPINLQLFPAAFSVDVDFDGTNDLIVTPNARNVSENETSCVKYKNTGSNAVSNFVFQTNSFLQEDMIEHGTGSIPILADLTGDGLEDLLVANFYSYKPTLSKVSKVAYYKNTGTSSQPKFTFIDHDFMNLSQQNYGLRIVPTFGDLDGDGKKDMLLGLENGTLVYYKNNGSSTIPNYNNPIVNYKDYSGSTINIGQYAAPQLFDLNKDGKLDLIVGERSGKLFYFENIGSLNTPQFQQKSSFLGHIDVNTTTPDGYPIPHFFNLNDSTFLLIGTGEGKIQFYEVNKLDILANYSLKNADFLGLKKVLGAYSSCYIADLDNDNKLNLFLGQDLGGLFHLEHDQNSNLTLEETSVHSRIKIYPNPTKDYVFIESDRFPQAYTLCDFQGRELIILLGEENRIKLDVQNLAPGIYFLKNNSADIFIRIVKE